MPIRWGRTLTLLLALSLRARPGSADDLTLWMPLGSAAPADALARIEVLLMQQGGRVTRREEGRALVVSFPLPDNTQVHAYVMPVANPQTGVQEILLHCRSWQLGAAEYRCNALRRQYTGQR